METKNLMIVGVGGQGSLLASKLLGHLLLKQGDDESVKSYEFDNASGEALCRFAFEFR